MFYIVVLGGRVVVKDLSVESLGSCLSPKHYRAVVGVSFNCPAMVTYECAYWAGAIENLPVYKASPCAKGACGMRQAR